MSDWKQMDLEELTSSAGDTRVSHSVTPGSDEARKMTVISGQKLKGSWLPYGPVGDCLRTLLDTSAWASTKCYLTWKQKATPGSRLLFQLAPLMPHTDATGYGLLHTPTATANQMAPSMNSGYRLWPTPTTTEAKSDTLNVQNRVDKNKQIMLCHAVRLWPTPTAHLSKEGGYPAEYTRNTQTLTAVATISEGMPPSSGPLNPTWVEWLMGYPEGWTDLKD